MLHRGHRAALGPHVEFLSFWEGGASHIFEAATSRAPDVENLREAQVIAELVNVHRENGVFPTPALELPEANGA